MKAKLFVFIGLVAAAVGTSLVFNAAPVHAADETYKWIGPNSIEASGGLWADASASGDDDTVVFTRNSSGNFVVFSPGACDVTFTLTPSISNKNGTLDLQLGENCSPSTDYDFDRSFSIADPQNGPPLPGSDVNFAELDCSNYVNLPEMGENFDFERNRCEAMQSCMQQIGNSQAECLDVWVTCFEERSNSFTCREDMVAGDLGTGGEDEEEDGTTCAIDGIGWILCPILNFTANIADGAYGVVANFLEVQPLLTTGTSEPIYGAWSIMRNFANVAFVIAFLMIIFSQITSVGISNYGIKKMLPRLIVAAILVNISYWVCAIAVDITNILGGSIKELFNSVGATFDSPDFSGVQGGATWSDITIGVLATVTVAATILYLTLSSLIPILITVVAALLMTLVILAVRQAIIILLVVISPLAFVAFLLPNTQNLFTKWRNLFQTLLLMFPIIALIFGASALASQVVTASAQNIDNEGVRIVTQIFGAGIASIPLLLTVIIPKLAGRLGNFVNDPSKGIVDRSRKRAEEFRDRRQNIAATRRLGRGVGVLGRTGKVLGGEGTRRRRMAAWAVSGGKTGVSAEQKDTSAQKALEEAQRNYTADRGAGDEKYAQRLAGPTGDVNAVQAAALGAQKKAFAESVSDMEALVKVRFDDPQKALEDALKKGDKVQAVAAQNLLFKSGGSGVSKFRDTVKAAESDPALQQGLNDVTSDLKENIRSQHGQFVKQKGADVVKWANSTGKTLDETTVGNLSNNDLAAQHVGSIKKAIERGDVSAGQAAAMLKDPRVSSNLDDDQKKVLGDFVQGVDIAHEEALQENARRNQPGGQNQPPQGP